MLGVEPLGAGEQDVAVGQVEGAGVAVVRVVSRQQARLLRLQVDFVDVSEGLLQEEDPLAIVREVGTLAEKGQPGDVRRKIAVGRRRRPVAGHGDRREGQGESCLMRCGRSSSAPGSCSGGRYVNPLIRRQGSLRNAVPKHHGRSDRSAQRIALLVELSSKKTNFSSSVPRTKISTKWLVTVMLE